MICYVYKSLRKLDTYLYIKSKDDMSDLSEQLLKLLGKLEYVMEVDLEQRQQLAQADIQSVKESLTQQGFYIQLPPGKTTL